MSSSKHDVQLPRRLSTVSTTKNKHPISAAIAQQFEVVINVYDLLAPGALRSILWTLRIPLVHTAVAIGDREYAYGYTNDEHQSGIFWNEPRLAPPGTMFRCSVYQGTAHVTTMELDDVLAEANGLFRGPDYNLLDNNCNHFTDHLCYMLTSCHAPRWMNRAAKVALCLPCIVPDDWVSTPEAEDMEQGNGSVSEASQMLGVGDTTVLQLADDEYQRGDQASLIYLMIRRGRRLGKVDSLKINIS